MTYLEAVKARTERATKGPWVHNQRAGTMGEPRVESEHEHGVVNDGWCIAETHGSDDEANATFISAARTDVPKLLALLDQAREALQDFIDNGDVPRRLYDKARRVLTAIAEENPS